MKKALADDIIDETRKAMDTLTETVYAATIKLFLNMQAERQDCRADGISGARQPGDDALINADSTVKGG